MTKDELHEELYELAIAIINDYTDVLLMGITITFCRGRKIKTDDVLKLIEKVRRDYNDGLIGGRNDR